MSEKIYDQREDLHAVREAQKPARYSPQFRKDDWPWKCAPGDQRLPKGSVIQLYESRSPSGLHWLTCYLPNGNKWVSSGRDRGSLLESVSERAAGMGLAVSPEIIRE